MILHVTTYGTILRHASYIYLFTVTTAIYNLCGQRPPGHKGGHSMHE